MKLLLIAPSVLDTKNQKGKQIHQLNLAVIAALATPYFSEIKIVEEDFASLDLAENADLVGITMLTCQATRGFFLADHFRKRGIPVICGGSHPSYMPEEALEHCDSVVIHEAENIWDELMADFQAGSLKEIYHSDVPADLSVAPMPRKDLYSGPRTTLNVQSLQTGRGCPLGCNFCTVTKTYGKIHRTRPVEHVVEEIKRYPGKTFFFVDDNIFFTPEYAYQLFEALIPLKIRWGSQGSLQRICKDEKLLALAVRSGCMSLFVGIESIEQKTLNDMHKAHNKAGDYEAQLKKIHKAGINLIGAFMFGFDGDSAETFAKVKTFAIKNRLMLISSGILTPFPGTDFFSKLEESGKPFDRDWRKYDGGQLVWDHPHLTREGMDRLKKGLSKDFYRLPSIGQRFWGNRQHPLYFLAMNFIHWKKNRAYRGNGR